MNDRRYRYGPELMRALGLDEKGNKRRQSDQFIERFAVVGTVVTLALLTAYALAS